MNHLNPESYTWSKALLWGNFIDHCKKMNRGSLGDRIVHGLIATTQLLPIIGQISSISEKLIVDHYSSRADLQRRNVPNRTGLEDHLHTPRPAPIAELVSDSTTSDDDDDAGQLLEKLERLHLSQEIQNFFDDLRSEDSNKFVLLEQIKQQIPHWPEYLRYLAKHQAKDFNLLFKIALESMIPEIYMDFTRVLNQADFDEHLASLNNCQIIFNNQVLPANSTVLRHISPYFESMFSSGLREAQTNIIHLPGQDYELFEKLLPKVINLHFFDESLDLSGDNLAQYLYLAEEYQFPLVRKASEEWILANFENIDRDPDFFNLADQYHLESIKSKMVHRLIPLYLESQSQKMLLEEWLPKTKFLDLGTDLSSNISSDHLEFLLKLCNEVETLKITICDKQSISLLKTLPNLRKLELTLEQDIDDEVIEKLQGLPISWLKIANSPRITDQGLAHLKGLPLQSLTLYNIYKITDQGLAYLRDLHLESLTLDRIHHITDQGLAYLRDLPLESLTLKDIGQITDQGLVYLKGLPLQSLTLDGVRRITNRGMVYIKDLPLKSLTLNYIEGITDQGLAYLRDLPLKSFALRGNDQITDQGLTYLKGLPLQSLTLEVIDQITDQGLAYLKGLSIESLTLDGVQRITDLGLAYLKDLPLKSLSLVWNDQITDQGLAHLKDLLLESLTLKDIGQITDLGLAQLIGLPLKSFVLTWDDRLLTAQGIAHLNNLSIKKLTLIVPESVTDQVRASLRENMPNIRVKFIS